MSAVLLILALVAAVAVFGWIQVARSRVRAHGLPMLVFRWLTGHPYHGQALTDAGWFRPGTRPLNQTQHVSRWWYRPRRVRTAWRTGPTVVVLLVLWGLIAATEATVVILAVLSAAVAGLGGWLAVRRIRGWKHHRTWIAPAHLVAAPLVGLPVASDPREWLEVAPDRSRVVASLPPGYNPDAPAKARLVSTLSSRLGLEAPQVTWQLAGPRPRLEITQSAPPPARVTLTEVRKILDGLKPDELLWGLGKKGNAVSSSLSGDSPHLGLSMGSGAGKSITARSLLAQQLHRGAIGVVLDSKFISHHWARDLPNVVIVRFPAEIHEMLLWLGKEVDRRNKVALVAADDEGNIQANVGPRIFIVAEELNATVGRLKGYWRENRTKEDPARSPALEALDSVSFMGRQCKANILYIGQRLSDKATGGGGDARENIAVIALARWRASTWKMLVPDFPAPPKSLTPGRIVVVSDQVQEVQGVYMTAREAQDFSLSGTVALLPSTMPGRRVAPAETAPVLAIESSPDLRSATASGPPPARPVSDSVTLRQAVEAGIFGRRGIAAARTLRFRGKDTFPQPVGYDGTSAMYDVNQLVDWVASMREE